jgi:hypothetical protein
MATRKARYKKLNSKTALVTLREDQIDASEYDTLTNDAPVTGVESIEEKVSCCRSDSQPLRDRGHVHAGRLRATTPRWSPAGGAFEGRC